MNLSELSLDWTVEEVLAVRFDITSQRPCSCRVLLSKLLNGSILENGGPVKVCLLHSWNGCCLAELDSCT